MSKQLIWGVACYAAFVFGQFLFLLKRAYSAKQNNTTVVTSIPQYFKLNAAPAFIRLCLEGVLYFILMHYKFALSWLVGMWGWHLPAGFVASEYANPALTLLAGYAVDSLVDWLTFSEKVPSGLRGWLKENVPQNMWAQAPKPTQGA